MRRLLILTLFLAVGCVSTTPILPGSLDSDEEVASDAIVLVDESRSREIPVRVWSPRDGESLPIIIFSHGVGESRDSYAWFGRTFARHGYVSIHLTHRGSDRAVLEKGWLSLYRSTKDAENWRNRPKDASFVVSHLENLEREIPSLAGRLDRERIAIAGHSAGAFTAIAIAGLVVDGRTFADARFRAAVAWSLPDFSSLLDEDSLDRVTMPILHVTGTRDSSLAYWTFARDRRKVFDRTPATNQYLATLKGGTHTNFSNPHRPDRAAEARRQQITADLTIAFLDRYLRVAIPVEPGWAATIAPDEMTVEAK